MKNLFRIAQFAALSLLCVGVSWVFFGVFVVSGMNHRLGSSMDNVGRYVVLSPCLIAIVLALASVIWNPRKAPGLIALAVAVATTWVLFSIGG